MKWNKLGKIFDPTQFIIQNEPGLYAQSPQALVFDDFVRIYFSTRTIDPGNKKFLSHIAYVDMNRNLRDVLRISDHTVIPLGGLGCFDEHGIFPMSVMRQGDRIFGYTCGWSRRVSVSVETAIGLAISHDNGISFQRIGTGPVLSASLHEPCLVGDGFVNLKDDTFHMWYIFGTGWNKFDQMTAPDRTYKIGHATSKDGVQWVKEEARQIIPDRLGRAESQALPTVLEFGGFHHMFFCYRESYDFRNGKGRGYRIGHAKSLDLKSWTRSDDELPLAAGAQDEWDSEMQCYPHIFKLDGKIHLLYNGNEFGRYGFGLAVLE
jgi:sucrose-6-phosphate hydrolase SacC (GH32 family)